MRRNKRPIILLLNIILIICLGFAIGIRINSINTQSLSIPLNSYYLGEEVPLDGSFITSSKENTQGYFLKVNDARLMSYNEYCGKYSRSEKILDSYDAKSIVVVEIAIRNIGNSEGYLDVMGWRLIPERGNEYYIADASLWEMNEVNAPGETGALALVSDSEYTVRIPFVRNVGEEAMFVNEITDSSFHLVVADVPTKKEIVFEV